MEWVKDVPPRQTKWVKFVAELKPDEWRVVPCRDEVQARDVARYLRKRYGVTCQVRGCDVYACSGCK